MPPRPSKPDYAAAFSDALRQQLAARSMTQSDLARANGVTPAYISRMASTGSASPEWVDMIADQLKLPDKERGRLHAAAARAKGYRIDLMEK